MFPNFTHMFEVTLFSGTFKMGTSNFFASKQKKIQWVTIVSVTCTEKNICLDQTNFFSDIGSNKYLFNSNTQFFMIRFN